MSKEFASQQPSHAPKSNIPRARRKRRLGLWILLILALLTGGAIYYVLAFQGGKFSVPSIVSSAVKTYTGHQATLKGEERGRTNIVVYGMTGDRMRTDSVVLVSYYWQQRKMVTLNIPRDLYIDDGYEHAKMGEVYAYAYNRQPQNASYPCSYVASVIEKEYHIPIDYWVKLNMRGEVELVNAVGGVDIDVPDAFTDYKYPSSELDNTGYIRPAPHFDPGMQHMNGERALIFSRSRHSLDNNEGSDFARSRRQGLVIQAVITKIKALGILGNIDDLSHYLKILGNNVDTNMSTDEIVSFIKTAKALDPQQDIIHGNWETDNGFLCNSTTPAGAYIILYGASTGRGTMAGTEKTSKYQQFAIYYIQHLLESAQQSPADFITTARLALKTEQQPAPPLGEPDRGSSSSDQ